MTNADASETKEHTAAYVQWDYGQAPAQSHQYLLPVILELCPRLGSGVRVLDVGCGNGTMAGEFLKRGCTVVGIDLSRAGIGVAKRLFPAGRFEIQAADDQLLGRLNEAPFDIVISTEVIEHLYDPNSYARGCFTAVKPGGRFICSTPYHGYFKNLFLSVLGKWDHHVDPLWVGGHIKLFSRVTLGRLLREAGFENIKFRGSGRLPLLWKSMVLSGDKAAASAR